jgi:hypothetical protein
MTRQRTLSTRCYRSSKNAFSWTVAERSPWCSGPVPRRKGAEGVNPDALTPTDGAFRTSRWTDNGGLCDRSRTLIRHAEATAPLTIRSLPMGVFQPARLRALIPVVGRTSLLAPSSSSAGFAAVALAMVAMAADEKERATAGATTKAWSDRSFRRVPFRCSDFQLHLITIPESWTTGRLSCTRKTVKEECDCGTEDDGCFFIYFSFEVQKTRIQMIDDMCPGEINNSPGTGSL